MLAPDMKTKKSGRRLSSLFTKAPADSQDSNAARLHPAAASEPATRLTKVRNRLSSATHLAPAYPPPSSQAAPRHVSLSNPTIQPVDTYTDFERLEPPPSLGGAGPGSRPSSRGSSPASSRPGTPSADAAAEGKLKKLRRKSGLFGGGQSTDGASGVQDEPLAWIVGHKGKVPYNLAMLLSGEKVRPARNVW